MALSASAAVLSSAARIWLALLLDAAVKGSLLLLIAWAVTSLMRRGSAAARHALWWAAVSGLLLLPAFSAAIPGWRVLPPWAKVADRAAPAPAPAPPAATAVQAIPLPARPLEDRPEPPYRPAVFPSIQPDRGTPREPAAAPPARAVPAQGVASSVPKPVQQRSPAGHTLPDFWRWLLILWACGGLAVISPSLLGAWALWRLGSKATRLRDPKWASLVDSIRTELGIRRPVRLLSAAGAMPMTWGVLRPRLLLPKEADEWNAQRRRVVLLHELGHVARWDCLAEWVAQVACAVYWFHPLLWIARRKMRDEREQACDNLVLRSGHSACGYAEHLLAVATAVKVSSPALAIAMARPTQLEMRLRTILDERISRRAITRLAAIACVVVAAGMALSLAMVRAADQKRTASSAARTSGQSPATRPATRPAAAATDDGPQHNYVLRAVDESGKPLAGVRLWINKDFADWPLCNADEDRHDALVETQDDGTATVLFLRTKTNVVASKKGYTPALLRGATLPMNKPLDIRLRVGHKISGTIRDEQNRPLAGAKIRATRQRFILDYLPDFVLTTTTDAAGHFELEHAAEGPYQILAHLDDTPAPLYAEPTVVQVPVDRSPAPANIVAHAGARIRGRYVSEHPVTLGGRRISIFCRLPKSSIWETNSEPDGSFTIDGIAPGEKGQISFAAPRGYVAQVDWTPIPPLCHAGTNQLDFDQLAPITYEGLVIRYRKEATVQGTIRDERGQPYVKADVIVDQTNLVYFTDSAGKFTAPIPPDVDATLRLGDAPFEDFQPKVGPIRAEEGDIVHKDLVVRRKAIEPHDNELSGRVVDAEGKPVSGARVYLANYGILPLEIVTREWVAANKTLKWKGGMFFPAEVSSDQDGRFSFNLLRDGKTDVFAEHESAQWAWVRDVGTNTKDLTLTLKPVPEDALFGGSVAGENGSPLSGAHVMIYSGDYYRGGKLGEADSDDSGRYSIRINPRPIDKACVRLICRRNDGAIAWRTLPACGGEDIRIRFKPTAVLHGRVVDKTQEPVAGATVWCDLERDPDWGELMLVDRTRVLSPEATTAADGRFEFHGLPAGSEATLFASQPNFEHGERWYIQQIGPKTEVPDIELPDGISIEGSVKFADSGKAAAGVKVSLLDQMTADPLVPAITDADGRFVLKGLTHTMFRFTPTYIRADSTDGELSGTFEYPNHLYSGDHVAGVEIRLGQSLASRHRQWLANPGKNVASKFLGVVLDDADPAREGRQAYHDTLNVYDSAGQVVWGKNDLNFDYGGAMAVQNPSDGLLWVYENQARQIRAFSPQGKLAWRSDAADVSDMAVDPQSGNVWVLTYGGGRGRGSRIQLRTAAGKLQREFDAAGSNLAYSPADHCFWIAGGKVQRLDEQGKLVTEAPVNFAFRARALAVNPQDGTVWVIEGKHPEVPGSFNRIVILGPDGQMRKEIELGNDYALSIALDCVRRVAWVQVGQSVRRISFDGKTLSELPVQGHICLEPDTGCAWVAGTSGIYRIDSDGRCLWAHESTASTDKLVFLLRP